MLNKFANLTRISVARYEIDLKKIKQISYYSHFKGKNENVRVNIRNQLRPFRLSLIKHLFMNKAGLHNCTKIV